MHKPKRVRGGIITLAIVFGFFWYAFHSGNLPFISGGGYTVRAAFSTGVDIRAQKTPVRVGGVDVGQVTGVTRAANGNGVVVTMNVTNNNIHLTNNASAQMYWRTLLGFQYYIQLKPGDGTAPLGNATIPLSRTGTQVELDQILASLTAPSRAGLRETFSQLASAFGAGNQAGGAIDELGPSMADVGPAFNALQGEGSGGDLSNTVVQANRLLGGLRASDDQLQNLISSGATTFAATGARQASIDEILQQGPATLDQTKSTLVRLDTTLGYLDPVARGLLPGARALAPAADRLNPALTNLRPLLDRARPTLVSLRPALTRLASASQVGAPLLNELLPTVNRLNATIIPRLQAQDPSTHLPLYDAIGPVFATIANSASLYDANGHVQTFHAFAASANSLGALPCDISLTKGLSCDDVKTVLGSLIGLDAASSTGEKKDH